MRYVLLIILLCSTTYLYSNVYIGVGFKYLTPLEELDNFNQKGQGLKLELTNKTYCKLWYGVDLEYLSLTKKTDIVNFFEKIISVNGFLKYAPFTSVCYDNKLIPYLNGKIGISSISPNETFDDQGSNLGFGGGIGIGVAYNFKLFKKCWMLELEGLYSAPNSIKRDKNRDKLNSINVGLTVSMSL